MVAQAIAAMKPVSAFVLAIQRFFCAHENRNVCAAQFRSVKRVSRSLLNINISRDSGNRQQANLGRSQRHNQGHGVIGSRVRVNQEERFHAA